MLHLEIFLWIWNPVEFLKIKKKKKLKIYYNTWFGDSHWFEMLWNEGLDKKRKQFSNKSRYFLWWYLNVFKMWWTFWRLPQKIIIIIIWWYISWYFISRYLYWFEILWIFWRPGQKEKKKNQFDDISRYFIWRYYWFDVWTSWRSVELLTMSKQVQLFVFLWRILQFFLHQTIPPIILQDAFDSGRIYMKKVVSRGVTKSQWCIKRFWFCWWSFLPASVFLDPIVTIEVRHSKVTFIDRNRLAEKSH